MSGSLTIPTTFNNLGAGNQSLALVDGAFSTVTTYVNSREITVGLASARPAFGTAGRYYFATDTNGGTLYEDTGTAWQQLAPGLTEPAQNAFVNVLVGLTLSNDGGTPNTILDVAAGACTDDNSTITSRVLMSRAAITGTTASTWVVGTAQPKLDAGSVGNNQTWHVFVIKRPDTGVVDILFSLSATAPTMPTNYTKKRRIGAFRTDGSAHIIAFAQSGDTFMLSVPVLDVNTTNPGTSAVTATLASCITGVVVEALLNVNGTNGSTNFAAYVSPLISSDQAASTTVAPLASFTAANNAAVPANHGPIRVLTNTSAQVRYRLSSSGASDVFRIVTLGWIDRRGQDQ